MTGNRRILVVDDNAQIHADFRKLLGRRADLRADFEGLEDALFGPSEKASTAGEYFDVSCASQGQEGHQLVLSAYAAGEPFAVAFVDMRMPPGWDGLETVSRILEDEPHIQLVICTAYSDHSWEEIVQTIGITDRVLVLKKPFDPIEARQLALSLTEKWTAIRRLAQQMSRMNELIGERTAELVAKNCELSLANARAEAAHIAKSAFLANMSHELRTPMTAILGWAHLLEESGQLRLSSEEYFEGLYIIRESGGLLLGLIDQVLEFSKVDAGKLDVEWRRAKPAQLAQETERLLRVRAAEKRLELSVELSPNLPESIVTDPVRVRQILINLVGNAIKFTSHGSVRIRVSGPWSSKSGERLCFEVEDTGIGISEDQIVRLFEPFSQADASISRRYGGTGLGLSLSRKLAELLGGELTLTSQPGRGSCFLLQIPTSAGRDIVESVLPKHEPAVPGLSDDLQPAILDSLRVLVVEDGRANQVLIRTILRKAGAEVMLAENGQLALEVIEQAEESGTIFDVVLMDMSMPVMDGAECTRALRKRGYSGLILAFTAHALKDEADPCAAAGCDGHLTKPIDPRLLVQKIHDHAKRR